MRGVAIVKPSMSTEPMKPKIVRQIALQYFLDAFGDYWLINPQRGWVRVPLTSRCLQQAIEMTKAAAGVV